MRLIVSNAMPDSSAPRTTFSRAPHCNGICSRFRNFQFRVTCQLPPPSPATKPFKQIQKLAIWQAIIDERTPTFGTDEPCLAQESQMKGNIGLRQARVLHDLRDRTAVETKAVKDAQPIGFGEQLQNSFEMLDGGRHAPIFICVATHKIASCTTGATIEASARSVSVVHH